MLLARAHSGLYISHLPLVLLPSISKTHFHSSLSFHYFRYPASVSETLAHVRYHSLKMPVKRSRAGSSSSYLESPSETPAASFVSPVKVLKTDGFTEPPRPTLLAVASPVNFGESDQLKIGGFLERCHYCKKRIAQDSEVFMYSTLCAFCSTECRNSQIALDQSAEKKPENTKEKFVPEQGFCNVKDLSNV